MRETEKPILKTTDLTMKYGQLTALSDLNLEVRKGEIFGYIGPNGAGKTTTFRILSGLQRPTSGRAVVADTDVTGDADSIKRLVGYLPDNFGIYPTLEVWEYLDFFAAAYRIPKKQRPERIDTCLKITNSAQFRDKMMGSLSRGMKQRVGIAKTLLHDPAVLILDEPAATIDPKARIQMRGLLRDLAGMGKAVLVSSHILPELADVCDTVGFLHAGEMVACAPVQQLMQTVRQSRLMEVNVIGSPARAIEILKRAPGAWKFLEGSDLNGTLRFDVQADKKQLADALRLLVESKIEVGGFYEVPVNLEDVFMTLTK
jgi:ABC-2 type transport system ATP-binding protein